MNKLRRCAMVLTVATALLALMTTPASAHVQYDWAKLWYSSTDCTDVRSEISHGNNTNNWAGYSRGDVQTTQRGYAGGAGWINCFVPFHRPPGSIAVRYILAVNINNQWWTCNYIDWHYNPSNTAHYAVSTLWAHDNIVRDCGAGRNYTTWTYGYGWNGDWHGGLNISPLPGHGLPAGP